MSCAPHLAPGSVIGARRSPSPLDLARARRLVLLLGALALGSACAPADPPDPPLRSLLDPATILGRAEIRRTTEEIRPGLPEDRPHLGAGWSRSEWDPVRERTFAWSTGGLAEVSTILLEPGPLDVIVEARAFESPAGLGPQRVTLELDGRELGTRTLSGRLDELRWTVEAPGADPGERRWTFRTSRAASPRETTGAPDDRQLAAAWYRIAFRPTADSGSIAETGQDSAPPEDSRNGSVEEAPRETGPTDPIAGPDGSLYLPWNLELRWVLDAAPGTRLRIGPARTRGTGRLEVEIQPENRPGKVHSISRAQLDTGIDLPIGLEDRNALVEIAVRALGRGADERAGVILDALAVLGPPAPPLENAAGTRGELGPAPDLIVLWVVDTLRADALPAAPEDGTASPAYRELARQGTTFVRALAQSSWTRASMGSVLTGLLPPQHGAYGRDRALVGELTTLSEMFAATGWRTAAVVTNPNLTPTFGFDQGFDHFVSLKETARAGEVVDAGLAWIDATNDAATPRFLWLHPLEPHAPYDPPARDREAVAPGADAREASTSLTTLDDLQAGRRTADPLLLQSLRQLYAAEIESADRAFGRLEAELRARGLWDRALILFLSDHGEELGEHGNWQHGKALYDESVRVPFVLKGPASWGPLPSRIEDPVQHIDLLPSLLDLAGLPVPQGLPGRSVRPLLTGTTSAPSRPVFFHLHLDGPERLGLELDGWKLLQELEGERIVREELYDLDADPKETVDLAGDHPVRRRYLASLLRSSRQGGVAGSSLSPGSPGSSAPQDSRVTIDPELEKSLRALGYVE